MSSLVEHEKWMRRALALAARALQCHQEITERMMYYPNLKSAALATKGKARAWYVGHLIGTRWIYARIIPRVSINNYIEANPTSEKWP